jgi:hypothetical protein
MEGVAMGKRTITCGVGAVFALTLLSPANVSARGLAYAHPGPHRGFHRMVSPYGYGYDGYGGPVATYTPGDYATPLGVPAQAAPAVTVLEHHCTMSRETVTVPAEAGGERKVTITRCP